MLNYLTNKRNHNRSNRDRSYIDSISSVYVKIKGRTE